MKLLPGVRLNMAKSGPSVSVGVPGIHYNIGSQGTRTTVGIPGTGLSIIDRKSWKALKVQDDARRVYADQFGEPHQDEGETVTVVAAPHPKSILAVLGIWALGGFLLMTVGVALAVAIGPIGGVIAIIAIGWPTLTQAAKYMP